MRMTKADVSLPMVSVIVPHLNDHARLEICLGLLHAQSYPADRMEVIVVDNGSTHPITGIIAAFPLAIEAFETEKGCGTARNRGLKVAKGDIVAFTDSDCRPASDWIANAVRRLTNASGADIIGGDIAVFAADKNNPTDYELFDMVFGFEQARYVRWKRFAAGANIVTTRQVLDAIGPFRNGNLPEDLEWGRRAVDKGFVIEYAPDVVISHPARRSWPELRAKIDRTVFHSRNLLREKSLFRLRWLLFTLALCMPPMVKVWKLLRTPKLSSFRFRLRAARALFQARYYRARLMLRDFLPWVEAEKRQEARQ